MAPVLLRVVWVVAIALLASQPVFARQVMQTMAVSATVSPSALVGFEVTAQPLTITSADVERGFVEVVMKSRMHLHTAQGRPNTALPPVVMAMEPRADLFKSVKLSESKPANGNGHGPAGAPGSAHVEESLESNGARVAEFRYRFDLVQAARLGQYETTISVAIDL